VGRPIEERWAASASLDSGASTIDVLTVEVATALWRLGGVADRRAIAGRIALIRGRLKGFTPTECKALYAAIAASVAMRAALKQPALLHQPGPGDERWALTDLARAVLGPVPAALN
jgi:hypothetical protein